MQPTAYHRSRSFSMFVYLAFAALMLLQPDLAMAQFEKATNGAQTFRDWLWLFIPIAALCIAGLFGLAYSMDLIRKDTLVQWGTGVVFSGAIAGGIIKLVY